MDNLNELKDPKRIFVDNFLANRLTGARDAWAFGYDVYGSVRRDLELQGFEKNSEVTKALATVITNLFFAFVSTPGSDVESLQGYEDYISEFKLDYDLENKDSLVYSALENKCTGLTTDKLYQLLTQAKEQIAKFATIDLNQYVYTMVSGYINNIDSIICSKNSIDSIRSSQC